MNAPRKIQAVALTFAAAFLVISKGASTAPLPINDNTTPPYLGVWEPMYQGTNATDAFANWLHRGALFSGVTQYVFDSPGWPAAFDRYWVDPIWGKWTAEVPSRRAVIILSLPTDSSSLEDGAKGGFDDKAISMTKYLVANNLGSSIVCMGLINGPNSWETASEANATHFVSCWQQIVTAMRTVPGAEKLQFDWVGLNRKTSFPIEKAYPGDAYVDYVGMFLYDQCLDKSIYPFPPNATDAEKLEHQKKAWEQYYYPASQNGLEAWMAVAKAHGKPFSIPMWSLYSDHYDENTISTGEDNSYFIQQMYNFIQDPANNVHFASYMDAYVDCTRITSSKEYQTSYPHSADLFRKLFGLPPAVPSGNP